MKGVVISVMVMLALIEFMMVQPGQALTCGQVDVALALCIPYLTRGGVPATSCCEGVKNIKGMVGTTADKRAACHCIKDAANRYSNLKDDAAQALPQKCGVAMDIPVSRTVNCHIIE